MKNFLIILGAILAGLLQVTVLTSWGKAFNEFNLVLVGLLIFILLREEDAGLLWLASGGLILDLYSSVRFGCFLGELLILWFILRLCAQKYFSSDNLLSVSGLILIAGLIFYFPWMIYFHAWQRLVFGVVVNLILGLPLYYLVRQFQGNQLKN